MAEPAYLTSEGLANLKAESEELRTLRRQMVAQRIQKAKEIGGTVDNAEYDDAKNEQAFIEGRILTLDNLINNAVIISEDSGPSDIVHIGSRVTVINQKGTRDQYTIIGSTEADPAQGRISNVSPIGKALLGKHVGDVAEVSVPAGPIKLEVVENPVALPQRCQPMPERGEDLLRNRKEKLEHIRQLGLDPFPPRYQRTSTALDAVALFREEEERHGEGARTAPMSVAGRIMSMRVMGKAAFLDLRDGSGKIQAHLRRDVLGEEYQLVKDLDLGDFLGVSGALFRTRTGEITVEAQQLTILAKSLRPLPEKWHGLRDIEQRYRQRYVDLISNPEVQTVFLQRSKNHHLHTLLPQQQGIYRSRHARTGPGGRGSLGKALHNPSPYPRPGALPADSHRALPQTAHCGRLRQGLRAGEGVQERGHGPGPQP